MPIIQPQQGLVIAPGTNILLKGAAGDIDPETRKPPDVESVMYQIDGGPAQPLAYKTSVTGFARRVGYNQYIGALGSGSHLITVTVEFSRDTIVDSVTIAVGAKPLLASLGGQYAPLVNQQAEASQTLVGLVDLHTHPAAHLGFGTEMFYGPPDGDPAQNFASCDGFHGPWNPIVNPEGNDFRQQLVDGIAGQKYPYKWNHQRPGWPDFPAWPTWHDRLHQQVRVEMLRRAWQGGLRLIVALAVNSNILGVLGRTRGPSDDKSAADQQILAIRELVSSQDFMGLALSPSDVRQIIGSGRLAVVIGLELDCIGNFYKPYLAIGGPFQPDPSDNDIRAEIDRLFAAGVRYFFPVHLVDNVFGGTALYDMSFNVACRYQTGAWIAPETAPETSQINFQFAHPQNFWESVFLDVPTGPFVIASLGFNPQDYPAPPLPPHRNSRGLQDRGRVALDELMRLGALIDVDHMSEKTVLDTLKHTQATNYPLFAGHNGIRGLANATERAHLLPVAVEFLNRGGMYGAGIKDGLQSVRDTIGKLRNGEVDPNGNIIRGTPNGGIALGSDCSGLEQLPSPRYAGSVVYGDEPNAPPGALQRCHLGNRAEDINNLGFSHVGMYPDFIEEGVSSGLLTDADVAELFNAPQRFVSAWQICLARRPVAYLTEFPGQGPMARVVDRSSAGDTSSRSGTLGHIAELSYTGPPGLWEANDLSARTGGPPAAGPPFGYLTNFPPDEGPTARVVYQAATDGRIWELSSTGPDATQWGMSDLTQIAGGPPAADTPHGYVTDLREEGPGARVVYWGTDGHIWELAYSPGQRGGWGANDLTARAGGQPAAGRPFGYVTYFPREGPIARVIYQGTDGHVWELNYPGHGGWAANDLTAGAGGQPVADTPFGYVTSLPHEGLRARVIYQSANGLIWELNYPGPPGGWSAHELNGVAGGQLAAGPPHGYLTYFTTGGAATARVVYQGTDGHVWELSYPGPPGNWAASDLSARTGGPPAAGPPFGYLTYLPGQGPIARVIHRSTDGHIWELRYPGPTGDWAASDLTTNTSVPTTTVPDVMNDTLEQARAALQAAHLRMNVIHGEPGLIRKVVDQDPQPGATVPTGTVVIVTMGLPRVPTGEQGPAAAHKPAEPA